MITIEDNYLITPDEAKNIIASWFDFWIGLLDGNSKTQTDKNATEWDKDFNSSHLLYKFEPVE